MATTMCFPRRSVFTLSLVIRPLACGFMFSQLKNSHGLSQICLIARKILGLSPLGSSVKFSIYMMPSHDWVLCILEETTSSASTQPPSRYQSGY